MFRRVEESRDKSLMFQTHMDESEAAKKKEISEVIDKVKDRLMDKISEEFEKKGISEIVKTLDL